VGNKKQAENGTATTTPPGGRELSRTGAQGRGVVGGSERGGREELTVGLLVAGTGTTTTELLGLRAPGVRDQQGPVVGHEQVLDLLLRGLINVLLVIRNHGLGDRLSDGVELGRCTSALHAHADVEVGETSVTQQQDWLEDLEPEDFRLEDLDGDPVDLQQPMALFAERHGNGIFLATKGLYRLLL